MNVLMLIFVILAFIFELGAIGVFIYNLARYKYIGNTYVYIAISFFFCLFASIVINFNNPYTNALVPISAAVFDSLKMAVVAFERENVSFLFSGTYIELLFGIAYIFTSIVTFAFLSLSVILSFTKIIGNGWITTVKRSKKDANIHYIFTDSRVTVSVRLAEELNKKVAKNEQPQAVTVFVSRSSLKTQEGTEFKDALVAKGIQVKAENFSENLANKIFKTYFPKYFKKSHPFNKNVYIYCMFSDDETPNLVASNFEAAITKNKLFQDIKKKPTLTKQELDQLDKFKIFVTYQDNDIDKIHNYSQNTLQIINTLSQYDMVSSEFMLENPIINFIDIKKLKSDPELDNPYMHVTFFGLGMINRPIFEKMTHAYQLWGDNINKVNYHILDRDGEAIVRNCSNPHTDRNGDLFLYSLDADCPGEDLFEYEVIDRYVQRIAQDENRFNTEGFELFVISLKNTNSDLKVAKNLRRALLKYVDKEKLLKVVIFLRIGEEKVAERLLETDPAFLKQSEVNLVKGINKYAPLVVYGENALMPRFINKHYWQLIKTGIVSSYAYHIKDNEKFDLNEEDEGYLKVRREWLDKDKFGFNKNVVVSYGLDTKIAVLNCKNIDDVKKIFSKANEETFLEYDIENQEIIKLASIEHNRWLAATYLMERPRPLDKKDDFTNFLKINDAYIKDKEHNEFTTKLDENTKHSCMVDNAGLRALYACCKEHGLKEEGFKLVFLNDIKPMQKYFEIIYSKKEKQ